MISDFRPKTEIIFLPVLPLISIYCMADYLLVLLYDYDSLETFPTALCSQLVPNLRIVT